MSREQLVEKQIIEEATGSPDKHKEKRDNADAEGESGSGVFCCLPGNCQGLRYRESILMGNSTVTGEGFLRLIKDFQFAWQAHSYDLLTRNCVHFADRLCQGLGVPGLPEWVRSSSAFGESMNARCTPEGRAICCCADAPGGQEVTQIVEMVPALPRQRPFEDKDARPLTPRSNTTPRSRSQQRPPQTPPPTAKAEAKAISFESPLECAAWPPKEGSEGSHKKRCRHGNGLGDGYTYFWNSDRGTASAACGQEADCDCCRRSVAAAPPAGSWRKAKEGVGCSNWRSIMAFETVDLASADKCGEYCRAHQGCVGFSYQHMADSLCSNHSGAGVGACQLAFGACQEEPNPCYDHYEMLEATDGDPAPQAVRMEDEWLRTEKRGCENWKDIQIEEGVTAADPGQCAALCGAKEGCMGFGFQTSNECDVPGAHIGACVLYSGECSFQDSSCWDYFLHQEVNSTTSPAASPSIVGQRHLSDAFCATSSAAGPFDLR